ncbi:MazG family protein [Leptospira broomii serovar Hurstbridge str. 5399]|uniref:MazG family protein n=1 Tax=Leptospira broomii serovar Hurstbridge str. 5399 TaxID=1049789 RepID=T0F4Y8_9LEPT|nr:nucleoside triphosphate pyrophosphohydrolase [Leptospira broomii]EQA46160.1 MazG family protein [Leptospira broomii serovar Hurstbridge str. 5399]
MKAPNPNDFPNAVEYLRDITAKLRSPDGCPWDRAQTHLTLVPYILEESHEVVDALLNENDEHIREELGDLLFQIVLHAQIASERGAFTFEDIANDVSEKLVLRHPHVFDPENSRFESADEVVANWDRLKEKEKQSRGKNGNNRVDKKSSVLNGVPETFPSLLKAEKLQKKAAKAGFDWPDLKGVEEKLREELDEFLAEIKAAPEISANQVRIEDELGDFFFSIVNLARKLGISSESALTRTNLKFKSRINFIEEELAKQGKKFSETPLELLDEIWNRAKIELKIESDDPIESRKNSTLLTIRELSSYLIWKETSENDWPKSYLFSYQSDEYRLIFSGFGSLTLLPLQDPWGRKGQPIFYLNLGEEIFERPIWQDLEGVSYTKVESIYEGILKAIQSYKEILK